MHTGRTCSKYWIPHFGAIWMLRRGIHNRMLHYSLLVLGAWSWSVLLIFYFFFFSKESILYSM
ncbi:MAG: hypothetical protein AYK18_03765 [Theionarchaea archaeon DG-70]|nr:MAG: hypothetical protein AYK18_03765 [Theionarchaea archaeon DG-70]